VTASLRLGMIMGFIRRSAGFLTGAAILFGATIGCYAPAVAGSDNSSDTYAGDYTGGSLPTGTFVALQYFGYFHAGAFIDSTGKALPDSHADVLEEFTRFAYIGEFGGHPIAVEVEIPFATVTNVNIPGTNNLVAGGLVDPVVHLTYFLTADSKIQRWFGITDYVYLPLGSFDNQKAVNVSTPDQFTDVLQIGYTEGLAKFSPALTGFFFDLVANASLHSDGNSPVAIVNPASASSPGVLTYGTLSQRTSYDVRAFLRYEPKPFLFVAAGIEKSSGGEQVATNGRFFVTGLPIVVPVANASLGKDDFLRGHIQFQVPLSRDFAVASDIFHDLNRVGGLREDIGVEVRLTKFFFPEPHSK
jgi:hypothetical protein